MSLAEVTGAADIQAHPPPVHDPFMSNFGDDPWLSSFFVPWDSMNF